jgi:hypothetical protein
MLQISRHDFNSGQQHGDCRTSKNNPHRSFKVSFADAVAYLPSVEDEMGGLQWSILVHVLTEAPRVGLLSNNRITIL